MLKGLDELRWRPEVLIMHMGAGVVGSLCHYG